MITGCALLNYHSEPQSDHSWCSKFFVVRRQIGIGVRRGLTGGQSGCGQTGPNEVVSPSQWA